MGGAFSRSVGPVLAADDKTTLDVIISQYGTQTQAWWTQFEKDFEAENPDIKLEFVTIPSKYADTMITKLAAGEIPDVMMLAMDQVPRYALNGMLMPLDDLASQALDAHHQQGSPRRHRRRP